MIALLPLAEFSAPHLLAWSGFLVFILVMLAVDLFLLHRKPHKICLKEALIGVLIPITVALAFIGFIYWAYNAKFLDLGIVPSDVKPEARTFWPTTGSAAALMYLTGYIVEIALSADNVFLFVVLMNFFAVPAAYQHRVLFWGVLGALVMRAGMILVGAELIKQFAWIIYVFGAFLIFTGIKMFFSGEAQGDPNHNIAVRLTKKFFPVTTGYRGQAFFSREPLASPALAPKPASPLNAAAVLHITPLFLVLICIEFTDLVFAVDSIPAIFGITQDPFIVFTSNVFAILGLRSMYFLLAGVMNKFHYLKVGLSAVLTFVGIKMILPALGAYFDADRSIERRLSWLFNYDETGHHHWHIKIALSLGFILVALIASIVASLLFPKKEVLEHNPLENT